MPNPEFFERILRFNLHGKPEIAGFSPALIEQVGRHPESRMLESGLYDRLLLQLGTGEHKLDLTTRREIANVYGRFCCPVSIEEEQPWNDKSPGVQFGIFQGKTGKQYIWERRTTHHEIRIGHGDAEYAALLSFDQKSLGHPPEIEIQLHARNASEEVRLLTDLIAVPANWKEKYLCLPPIVASQIVIAAACDVPPELGFLAAGSLVDFHDPKPVYLETSLDQMTPIEYLERLDGITRKNVDEPNTDYDSAIGKLPGKNIGIVEKEKVMPSDDRHARDFFRRLDPRQKLKLVRDLVLYVALEDGTYEARRAADFANRHMDLPAEVVVGNFPPNGGVAIANPYRNEEVDFFPPENDYSVPLVGLEGRDRI